MTPIKFFTDFLLNDVIILSNSLTKKPIYILA